MKGWCFLFAGLITTVQSISINTGPQVPLVEIFKTFRHSEYQDYSIRIKEQSDDICDAGSRQYTGWLDFNGKHMFFWYFDSLNDPDTDPLTLWLTGGPGVSGMVGMMLELGPCRIDNGGKGTHRNRYSWTKNSSMIFLDQPVGTGLSYVDPGTDIPTTSQIGAKDIYIFLQIFLSEVLPERRKVPFHIAGESYAGHYIPTLSAEILQQNLAQTHLPKIPLKTVLIGNGLVSPLDRIYGYYETLCTTKPGVDEPVFNKTRCTIISEALPRCQYLYEACYEYPDEALCRATDEACGTVQQLFHNESYAGGRDPFDITRTCEIDHLCYSAVLDIQQYISAPNVWKALGVPQGVTNYSIESEGVSSAFEGGIDFYTNVMDEVRFALENGVDVLIYNGNLDLACNTAGNLRWTNSLRWSGQADFASQDLKPWNSTIGGRNIQVGSYKEVFAYPHSGSSEIRRLTLATIDRSGHMVPLSQPEVALDLYQRWLFQQSFE